MTVPTPSPAAKLTPAPGAEELTRAINQRAVGHVGIVAGVLDDSGAAKAVALFLQGERKGGRLAAGQADRNRIGKVAADQRGIGGARRRRRAGAGGPAAPQGGLSV